MYHNYNNLGSDLFLVYKLKIPILKYVPLSQDEEVGEMLE